MTEDLSISIAGLQKGMARIERPMAPFGGLSKMLDAPEFQAHLPGLSGLWGGETAKGLPGLNMKLYRACSAHWFRLDQFAECY